MGLQLNALLAGRFAGVGAPWWVGVLVPLLALLALIPRATRIGVVVCWLVAAVAAVVAVPLARLSIRLPGLEHQQLGLGAVLLVLGGAWITAIVLGSLALRDVVLPKLVQAGVALCGAAAIVVPVVGLGWFAVGGGNELPAEADNGVPVFMEQQAERGDQYGVLVLRGNVAQGLSYQVIRGDGPTVGEDEIEALTPADPKVHALLQDLVTAPSPSAVADLSARGIRYIVEPVPGWLSGGPNPRQQDLADCKGVAYASSLPALSWIDHACSYASNEIAINWNAPLVYVSAGLQALTPP